MLMSSVREFHGNEEDLAMRMKREQQQAADFDLFADDAPQLRQRHAWKDPLAKNKAGSFFDLKPVKAQVCCVWFQKKMHSYKCSNCATDAHNFFLKFPGPGGEEAGA